MTADVLELGFELRAPIDLEGSEPEGELLPQIVEEVGAGGARLDDAWNNFLDAFMLMGGHLPIDVLSCPGIEANGKSRSL